MDLSSSFDLPNPFGLLAVDFGHDLDSYRAALGFLSDLATGSEHDEALTGNGGNPGMLIGWQRSDKFRRVYTKCRKAGAREREYAAEQEKGEEHAEAAWENEGGAIEPMVITSYHLPDPLPQTGAFSMQPNRGRWGYV